MLHPPGNRLSFPCRLLVFCRKKTDSVYAKTVEKQAPHADCQSVASPKKSLETSRSEVLHPAENCGGIVGSNRRKSLR